MCSLSKSEHLIKVWALRSRSGVTVYYTTWCIRIVNLPYCSWCENGLNSILATYYTLNWRSEILTCQEYFHPYVGLYLSFSYRLYETKTCRLYSCFQVLVLQVLSSITTPLNSARMNQLRLYVNINCGKRNIIAAIVKSQSKSLVGSDKQEDEQNRFHWGSLSLCFYMVRSNCFIYLM